MKGTSPIKNFNFDDEPVCSFFCDFEQPKIEIGFNSYYKDYVYVERKCLVIIEQWKGLRSKICTESKFYEFPTNLGMFSMLLYSEEIESTLKITVNTIDGRYLDVHIDTPIIKIIEL